MSVSPDSSVSQRDVGSIAVDSRPFFPFEVFTQLDGMSPAAVQAVQRMYEAYCQACVSVAETFQSEYGGSGSSSGASSSTNSRPNRRQRRRASRKARSRGSSSVSLLPESRSLESQSGYCYLRLIKSECRDRVAGQLGRSPSFAELARLSIDEIDKGLLDGLRFQRTALGKWHCGDEGQYSVDQVMSALKGVYCTVLGSFGSQYQARVTDLQISHLDSLGFFEAPVSIDADFDWTGMKRMVREFCFPRRSSMDVLAYSLDQPELSQQNLAHVHKSSFYRSSVVVSEAYSEVRTSAQFDLRSTGLAVVKCPERSLVELNGSLLGNSRGSVYIAFKGNVSFSVRVDSGTFVDVPVLTDSKTLDGVIEYIIPTKSTAARFLRSQGGTAVLSRPRVKTSTAVGTFSKVPITDPLEDWVAVQETRYQADVDRLDNSYSLVGLDWQAFTAFRSEDPMKFHLDQIVRPLAVGSVVLMERGVSLSVRAVEDLFTFVGGKYSNRWSLRRLEVAEPYVMDGGGPSDSEFSDAL